MLKQQIWTVAHHFTRWEPEPILESYWLSKFSHTFIKKGYGVRAEKLMYGASMNFKNLFPQTSFYLCFIQLIYELKPVVGLGHRRLGLLWISVPHIIKAHVGLKKVIRWLGKTAMSAEINRSERSIEKRINATAALAGDLKNVVASLGYRQLFLTDVQESTRYKHFRWV
jgi:ribosomal protein S7